ncbi:NAD(P)/FAD-dependent oxidoreductase [Flavobacterium sp. CBA20B-1]|uniref:NAD(P)/FAD-dependent oxidoreductase n=1 Tax=unclassified Flavobacterium TaxID=196869 RepID=UPI0022253DC5|nr:MULTISPECIES: NAD(P)/FAD-dependent oxidoreductase [unclassified Flavobacterium]WCM41783.1 NAD(P)/FAD-dependent oxidoreductase [Flavobacterium sp. CBA20B-1]
MHNFDVIIIGGGASGFFTAINLAMQNPDIRIAILERSNEVLSKVKISGGGRCNVTHACFIPNMLTKYYPRGEKELKGPFHTFCTGDVMEWFSERGVLLKIEEDGRVFPESDNSQTIIDCFLNEAENLHIKVIKQTIVQQLSKEENLWKIETSKDTYRAKQVVMATGSNVKIWDLLKTVNHTIVNPVPSLFTFNIKDDRIKDLMGVSTEMVSIKVKDAPLKASGPLLITHWGMSGPAILRLSAWGARELFQKNYQFQLIVNFTNDLVFDEVLDELMQLKKSNPKKTIYKHAHYGLTMRLWHQLVLASGITEAMIWADVPKKQLVKLAEQLTQATFNVNGKSTFKDEFVTAGGIDLKEVNFKTMESKLQDNLYFTGEILNIDAITGGFNFQNAWTTGFLAANAIAAKY